MFFKTYTNLPSYDILSSDLSSLLISLDLSLDFLKLNFFSSFKTTSTDKWSFWEKDWACIASISSRPQVPSLRNNHTISLGVQYLLYTINKLPVGSPRTNRNYLRRTQRSFCQFPWARSATPIGQESKVFFAAYVELREGSVH